MCCQSSILSAGIRHAADLKDAADLKEWCRSEFGSDIQNPSASPQIVLKKTWRTANSKSGGWAVQATTIGALH
jgi:hypothetical protein